MKIDLDAILARVTATQQPKKRSGGRPKINLDAIIGRALGEPPQGVPDVEAMLDRAVASVGPGQDNAGPVTAWWTPGDGLVLNDATFPIEVASYLWKGERAFFQAAIRKPASRADELVQKLWLRHLPEFERTKLRSWCPADVALALTDEVARRTGDHPQWTVWIMPLAGSPYYKFHPEAMEKVLAHSAVVCPEPCEIDLSDPAFEDVKIAAPATTPTWMPFRPLASVKSTRGRSQEVIATWVTPR